MLVLYMLNDSTCSCLIGHGTMSYGCMLALCCFVLQQELNIKWFLVAIGMFAIEQGKTP